MMIFKEGDSGLNSCYASTFPLIACTAIVTINVTTTTAAFAFTTTTRVALEKDGTIKWFGMLVRIESAG